MEGTVGTCGNCGSEGEIRLAVHRVYLVPEETTLKEIEQWCPGCRSQYPHAHQA
ncbi:MAG: hypothetical protein M3063_16050 [Actinomycetota bacterium]|nr:hypothetical protein [Actinomycetota bacterium]